MGSPSIGYPSAGPLAASGAGELHASNQPNHEENNQHEAKSPTEP